jgi:hypothetical protein
VPSGERYVISNVVDSEPSLTGQIASCERYYLETSTIRLLGESTAITACLHISPLLALHGRHSLPKIGLRVESRVRRFPRCLRDVDLVVPVVIAELVYQMRRWI